MEITITAVAVSPQEERAALERATPHRPVLSFVPLHVACRFGDMESSSMADHTECGLVLYGHDWHWQCRSVGPDQRQFVWHRQLPHDPVVTACLDRLRGGCISFELLDTTLSQLSAQAALNDAGLGLLNASTALPAVDAPRSADRRQLAQSAAG